MGRVQGVRSGAGRGGGGNTGSGASAHWDGAENGHGASQWLKSTKPQRPCNRERNRARSHRPFHEERVRPRRLFEPGRPVTEGASDSNPVNGFRGGGAECVPPFALWDWRRFPSVHAGAKTLSKTAANRIYRCVRKLIASHVGLHSGSRMVS